MQTPDVSTKVPLVPEAAFAAGFSNEPIGTHIGKTMMLPELRLLLAQDGRRARQVHAPPGAAPARGVPGPLARPPQDAAAHVLGRRAAGPGAGPDRRGDDGAAAPWEPRWNAAQVHAPHAHLPAHVGAHDLASGMQEGDVQKIGGWREQAMLSRYGASAATDRALAAKKKVGPAKW